MRCFLAAASAQTARLRRFWFRSLLRNWQSGLGLSDVGTRNELLPGRFYPPVFTLGQQLPAYGIRGSAAKASHRALQMSVISV